MKRSEQLVKTSLARSNAESLEQGFKMARTQLEYMVWTF